jgi:deazaflavin-dependent oxidoreductase (nitroreductase family)
MTAVSRLRPVTKAFNPIFRPVASWVPGFVVLEYTGRKTGRPYRIPVKLFRHGPDYVIAFMYGSDVEWAKNVLAAGGAGIRDRNRTTRLTDPRIVADSSRRILPMYARPFFGLMRVNDFMTMRALETPAEATG